MSTLAQLDEQLQRFTQLPYHNNPPLKDKLYQVQEWQRARIRITHATLFSKPENHAIANYFLHRLYGGEDFERLVDQLHSIVPKAQKIERMVPKATIDTGNLSIQSTVVATELDLELAIWLMDNTQNDGVVNETNMLQAYRAVDAQEARRGQIETLKQVCYKVDKHVNSFMLRQAFKLTKATAYKHHYHDLYDFIDDGFNAMKPLKKVSDFIEPFCETELKIIDEVHAN